MQTGILKELTDLNSKGGMAGICAVVMTSDGAARFVISPGTTNLLAMLGGIRMVEEQICMQIKKGMDKGGGHG
jgi:hypothetical protein